MYYTLEAHSLTLHLKVNAGASSNGFKAQTHEEYLSIRVAGIREKGKANDELIAYLSSKLKVPKSHFEILSGATSPHKKLRIVHPNPSQLLTQIIDLIPKK